MDLAGKIASGDITVGVIGLGYVGLPLVRAFHQAGIRTMGFDIDQAKVDMLKQGRSYLKHLGEDFVRDMAASDRFEPTSDLGRLDEPDAILSCVPTPLGKHLEPDLSFVLDTTKAIAKRLRRGQLVVLESTTYPTTTRLEMKPILDESGLKCGEDYFLAYSPEREDPGRKDFTTQSIPKLVGGIDPVSGKLAEAVYRIGFSQVIPVSSAEVAEAAKLTENVYRAVNIALVNELKMIYDSMGIDVWEVIDAAATKPFGFQPFYPGPGLGGHCIPIDPFYLTWKAQEVNKPTQFIELAGRINRDMPHYVVQKCLIALNQEGVAIKGAKVLILGIAYKPDVDDVRESPSFEVIDLLRDLGAVVDYNDPHVPFTKPMRRHDPDMKSVELTPAALKSYDCVVVATNHAAYDMKMVQEHAKLIVDTRGATRKLAGGKAKIVSA